jgi:localization factor PodJL
MGVVRGRKVRAGMKPGIPWSVKGIDTEAREAAKHAARRSGMTLGEWLNTVIREQAEDAEPPKKPAGRNPMSDIRNKLDLLSEQLTRMTRRDQDTAAGRYYERSRPAQPEQSLAEILARVEASERHAAENFAEFGERLDSLGNKFATDRFPQEPEDVPGYRSLETAVRNIVDHIEVSERKTRETMKSVQDRMDQVAYAATAPIDSDRLLADAPVIARLENRIADLTSRITGKDDAINEDFRKLVHSEVGKLAARIDSVRQASEMAAERTRQQVQKDQHDSESRMQEAFGAAQVAGEIGHLRTEMESLGQRVDDLRAEAASEHDLRSLRVVIEQLSARVAQGPDLRPLADLDRRLTEITKWLEQGRGDHVGNQIADLEQRVFALDNRIAEAMRRDHVSQVWAGAEREFAGLSDRLTNTEQQLQHLATLEQSIHQLYQSMEQSRNWSRDVAEDAANRMASRLMQDWPAKAQAQGPSPELQALEEALAAVRTNYETADRRNQETLGAVHETLEQIVNKLTELEELRGEPQGPVPAKPVLAAEAEVPTPSQEPQSWPGLASDPGLETYRPLNPSSASLVEPVAPIVQDDFIAAARRAAQAAAQQTPGPSASGFLSRGKTADTKASKAPSRFSLRFRRREKQLAPSASTAPAKPGKENDPGKRRRLILIGLVLLAAASALAYNNFIRKPASNVPPTPPAVEQTKPQGSSSSTLQGMSQTVASSLTTALAKSDAMFGSGNFASSLPIDVTTTANEVAITDADALPQGIGSEKLRQAALDGDANAAFVVAARFAEGKNVRQDYKAAARWYRIAAAKGLAPAQYRLGTLLERGTGMPANLDDARRWYERAAEAGNVRAMHNAAVLFANGEKTEANYQKAAHWFGEAAAHNLKDSQFNVAVLYERGLGVGQDLGEAFFWYSLAARQNDQDAVVKAKTLENTLPKTVSSDVKSRLAQWKPKPDLDRANVVAIANAEWQDRSVAAPASDHLPILGAAIQNVVSGDTIAQAQALLHRLGYDVGDINGAMGSRTRNSIRLFELQSGMSITGEVTPELLAKLRAKAG